MAAAAGGITPASAGLARTETRTQCSECGIETTVPFKPTQGRPVLCRQCFQVKARAVVPATVPPPLPAAELFDNAEVLSALTGLSTNSSGAVLSADAAVVALTSMSAASAHSSIATQADLASISALDQRSSSAHPASIPAELVVASGAEERALKLQAVTEPNKA